ncbi:hypothetical protein YC2023_020816 [Brassica napus]
MRKRSMQTEDMVKMDMVSPMRSMMKRRRQTEDIMETDVVSPHISVRHKSTDLSCSIFFKSSATRKAPIFNITPWLLTMTGLSFTLTWVNNYVDEEAADVQG